MTDGQCYRYWGNTLQGSTMMCVLRAGTGDCFGDSGGPLVAATKGRFILVGVVSFGKGDGYCDVSYPSVFTEVSAYLPFINQFM